MTRRAYKRRYNSTIKRINTKLERVGAYFFMSMPLLYAVMPVYTEPIRPLVMPQPSQAEFENKKEQVAEKYQEAVSGYDLVYEEDLHIEGLGTVVVAHVNKPPFVTHPISGKDADNFQYVQEVKAYMRYKFKDNYKTACMVAYGESLGNRYGINSSPVEYSVGTFQINLADNYGQGRKIHWDKVPGSSLKEKTDWLQNPINNIDLAFTMSDGGTNWFAWSAFTNKSYLRHADKCN